MPIFSWQELFYKDKTHIPGTLRNNVKDVSKEVVNEKGMKKGNVPKSGNLNFVLGNQSVHKSVLKREIYAVFSKRNGQLIIFSFSIFK